LGCSLTDYLGALIASNALSYTRALAGIWGLLRRHHTWHRTNKFKALPSGLGALDSARGELLLGLAMSLFSLGAIASFPQLGLHYFFFVAVLFQGTNYLAAPALALLAEWDIRSRRATSGSFVREIAGGIPYVQEAGRITGLRAIMRKNMAETLRARPASVVGLLGVLAAWAWVLT
jgi:hypothetical protein